MGLLAGDCKEGRARVQNSRGPEGRNVWEDVRATSGPGSYRAWDRTQMETRSQAGGLAGEATNTGSGTSAGQTDLCPAWPHFLKLPQTLHKEPRRAEHPGGSALGIDPSREAKADANWAQPFPNTHCWGWPD